MKKFILFLGIILGFLVSCEDIKPEYNFQLELKGSVVDSLTLSGDFIVNLNKGDFVEIDENNILSIAEYQEVNTWLDGYIQKNIIDEFSNTTEYCIYVKGFIYDTASKAVFGVDKMFTNN